MDGSHEVLQILRTIVDRSQQFIRFRGKKCLRLHLRQFSILFAGCKIPRNSWEIYGRFTKILRNSVFCLLGARKSLEFKGFLGIWRSLRIGRCKKNLGIRGKFTDA